MFVRKWSNLPADPMFPSGMKELGYFINDEDEIRSIESPDYYFKYFINRNERWNERQRFYMNQASQAEIHSRLERLGMRKIELPDPEKNQKKPQNGTGTAKDHNKKEDRFVPIFIDENIASKSRIVLIVGETHQDLGVLAQRVIGGPGGIDKGSMVSIVQALWKQEQSRTASGAKNGIDGSADGNGRPGNTCGDNDDSTPGIIIANPGELLWWPEGKRTLCMPAFQAAPMRSAAHIANAIIPSEHYVPGNESPKEHVKCIFDKVIGNTSFVGPDATIDILGVGNGAEVVQTFFDDEAVWKKWGGRIGCFAIVGGMTASSDLECEAFKCFLRERARAFIGSTEPEGVVISGPDGNPNTTTFTDHGCPVVSAGESKHLETLLITTHPIVLEWLDEVASTPEDQKPYKNPIFTVLLDDLPPADMFNWTGEEDGGVDVNWDADTGTYSAKTGECEKREVVDVTDIGEDEKDGEKKDDEDGEQEKGGGEGDGEKEKMKVDADRNNHVVFVESLSDSADDN